jgi:hypothetical protein
VLLSERGEGSNGSAIFHISTILEATRHVNNAERIFYPLSCDMTNSKMSLMQGSNLRLFSHSMLKEKHRTCFQR